MRLVLLFLLIPIMAWGTPTCKENYLYCPWLVYYGNEAQTEMLQPYNPIVLDTAFSPPLKPLLDENKILYGYLSLGEVEDYRAYFSQVMDKGLIIKENPNWPGSYFLDIRKEAWTRLVLDHLIPDIILEGFQGVFLDTLDNPIYLEEQDPEKYKGMTKAAIQLVQLIRVYFPSLKIMVNRAYALLPEIGDSIHVELAESLYTNYNFKTKKYTFVEKETYDKQVALLQEAQKKFPHLQVFSLDYWFPDEPEIIKKIYAVERTNGLRPYVGTIHLDRIIPEPKE